jgi:hypothetical protein
MTGPVLVPLTPVDVRCCGRIDEQIELGVGHLICERLCQVQIRATKRENFEAVCKSAAERCAQPAIFAENGDPAFHWD